MKNVLAFAALAFLLLHSAHAGNATVYLGNWTIDQGARLSGPGLSGVSTAIQLPNGDIRLYYCEAETLGSQGSTFDIISATSHNGLNFTPDLGTRISDGSVSVCNPNIVKLTNGSYRMYYSTFSNADGSEQQLYTAVSKDGINFTNQTPLTDPNDKSWNTEDGFTSEPVVQYAANGTLVMYYNSGSIPCQNGLDPTQTQHSAISTDGIHFTPNGCVLYTPGYDYGMPISDFSWALLPNGTAMFIGDFVVPPSLANQPLPGIRNSSFYGFYVSYSTDSTLLHYSIPKRIIKMSWPSAWFSDPEVIALSNGTYRMYYNVHINETNGNGSIVIESATWKPIAHEIQINTAATTTIFPTANIPSNHAGGLLIYIAGGIVIVLIAAAIIYIVKVRK